MESRPFGTCFFEQYAQITLQAILGDDFAGLVNRDRPDLQSPDGRSLGIEVTRAMEQSREDLSEAEAVRGACLGLDGLAAAQ